MQSNDKCIETDRETVVDVLKGISVIFVIITHYNWSEKQRLIGLFPFFVDMAVPIFMIISGYVFTKSYIKKGIVCFENAYELPLILKRLLRYVIPFMMAYVIELAWFFVFGDGLNGHDIVANFFGGGIGQGSYYFPMLIQITFFLPVILFSIYERPAKGLLFWFAYNGFYEMIEMVIGLDPNVYRLSLFRYSFLIACGCFIYLQKGKEKIKRVILFSAFSIGFVFIFVTCYLGYETKIINNIWKGTSYMSALYIAPIVMLIIYRFGTFSFKPLELVGKASFNIFLTQMVYYASVSESIKKYSNSIFVHVGINVVICVSVGILFYYIESSITNRIIYSVNRLIKSEKQRKL